MDIRDRKIILDAIEYDGYGGANTDYFLKNDRPVFLQPEEADETYEGHDGLNEGDDVRFLTVSTSSDVSPELILNSLCQKGLIYEPNSPTRARGGPSLVPISIYTRDEGSGYPESTINIVFEDKSVTS